MRKVSALLLALSIGAFCFAATPLKSTPPEIPKTGTLSIKAGVVMKSGDVKWVAKRNFYLMPVSIIEYRNKIFNPADTLKELDELKGNDPEYDNKINHAIANMSRESDAVNLIWKHLPPSEIQCLTSFEGECVFNDIPPGKYYLTPYLPIKIGQSNLFWDLPVTIEAGQAKSVELSNDNMTALLSIIENHKFSPLPYRP